MAKRLSDSRILTAIEKYAAANRTDPFAARRAASRIKNNLFHIDDGEIVIWS